MAAGPTGRRGVPDRFRVRVLRAAEHDEAWRECFKVPDDAKELQFKLALLEGCGAVPPKTRPQVGLSQYLDMDSEEIEGLRLYALEYRGIRGEREPWIVALFYLDESQRISYITHVVHWTLFQKCRMAVFLLAASRAMQHRTRKRR